MHIVKCDAYTNALSLGNECLYYKLCASIYAYMNIHTSYALTHTHMDTNAQAHRIIRTSKHLCQYI